MHRELHTPCGQWDYKQNVKFNLSSSPMDYRPDRFCLWQLKLYIWPQWCLHFKNRACAQRLALVENYELFVMFVRIQVCVCSDSCDGSIDYICSWTLLHLMSRSNISQGLNFTTNSWRKWFTDLVLSAQLLHLSATQKLISRSWCFCVRFASLSCTMLSTKPLMISTTLW